MVGAKLCDDAGGRSCEAFAYGAVFLGRCAWVYDRDFCVSVGCGVKVLDKLLLQSAYDFLPCGCFARW